MRRSAAGRRSSQDKRPHGISVALLFCYSQAMLDVYKILPKDPDELRQFTALLLAEVKSQAFLIEKLRHQLAG